VCGCVCGVCGVCVCVCDKSGSGSHVISDTGEVSKHSRRGPVIHSIPYEYLRPNWYAARGIFTILTEFFNPGIIIGFILHG
jgi:hypothetical protein